MLNGVQGVEHTHEGHLYADEVTGRYRHGSWARRTTAVTGVGAAAFDQDDRQHAQAIAEGVQVAHPVDPGMLEARDFGDAESLCRDPHVDQRLDLEAVSPQPPVALV